MSYLRLLAAGAALALAAPAAHADCAADLAALEAGSGGAQGGGIAKDGTTAPLEGAEGTQTGTTSGGETTGPAATGATSASATAGSDTAAAGGGIAKDGSHTPLEGQAGGSQDNVAMSGDDAQAQQEGAPTAAEQATGGGSDMRAAAIKRAHEALAANDEDACRKALEEAAAM
ncbi:hypothetical protein [Paracoccus yeei]|uniref:Uncharacterized protein n=1 Tax=Paracoccus yeei TaxID=147645 RepID=A0A2D2C772_9RHOB|nr:hypothetical protein [Paracoccus yeei]ATQ58355.1 hypothetical protein PYTT13_21245 [Paracoccus yeei]